MADALPALEGVARTALWTVYCRARCAEAAGLHDPEARRICEALGPGLRHAFGRPAPSFAVRARDFDRRLQGFLDDHPGAAVVSLGEGLETQCQRLSGYGSWTSVDLPRVLDVRARYLAPDEKRRHRPGSATDHAWLGDLGDGPAAVVAQGLLMYLDEAEVRRLTRAVAERGDVFFLFDVVPPWLSQLSRFRLPFSRSLRIPRMPWGVRETDLPDRVRGWLGHPPADLELWPIPMPSGPLPGRYTTVAAQMRC